MHPIRNNHIQYYTNAWICSINAFEEIANVQFNYRIHLKLFQIGCIQILIDLQICKWQFCCICSIATFEQSILVFNEYYIDFLGMAWKRIYSCKTIILSSYRKKQKQKKIIVIFLFRFSLAVSNITNVSASWLWSGTNFIELSTWHKYFHWNCTIW